MQARQLAVDVRQHYDVTGVLSDEALERILGGLLIHIAEYPLSGRLRELCCDRVIVLRPGLSPSLRRWLICHAVWHIMHGFANHIYLDQLDPVLRRRDEQHAEKFAGWLLLGADWGDREPWDIAEEYTVPEERLYRWLRLVS